MESDRPLIPPSTHPRDPLHSHQPASTDDLVLQGSRSDARMLDPPAPSQGASVYPEILQRNSLTEIDPSTLIDVYSYSSSIPNIPHINMRYPLLPPSQLIQSQPLGILQQYPYFGQPQTIHPYLTTSVSLNNWQQSTSLPQNGLDPHPQSQELIGLPPLDFFPQASTSSGPLPEAATANLHRESVDGPGPQVTSISTK